MITKKVARLLSVERAGYKRSRFAKHLGQRKDRQRRKEKARTEAARERRRRAYTARVRKEKDGRRRGREAG